MKHGNVKHSHGDFRSVNGLLVIFFDRNPKDGLVRQAVSSSKRDDVKNLLEEGGDVDEVEPKTLSTPLMLAVRDGSKEIVQLLLDYDADVTRRDKDGTCHAFAIMKTGLQIFDKRQQSTIHLLY